MDESALAGLALDYLDTLMAEYVLGAGAAVKTADVARDIGERVGASARLVRNELTRSQRLMLVDRRWDLRSRHEAQQRSVDGAVRFILKQCGKPLRLTQLAHELALHRSQAREDLVRVVDTLARSRDHFFVTSDGAVGLREWLLDVSPDDTDDDVRRLNFFQAAFDVEAAVDQLAHRGNCVVAGLGVTRSVGQEDAIGALRERVGRAGLRRQHDQFAAAVGQQPQDVALDAVVVDDHAEAPARLGHETGAEPPSEPILFNKWSEATGPNDHIVLPKGSKKTDWEVELGVVIGTKARYVPLDNALQHVAGYCVVNDVSEREYQIERGGTWDKGKGCDTFGPIGPWLVTADEVTDPQNLAMWLDVNGKRFQNGNTRTMIFDVAYLVHYISQFVTLNPGDLISTGTPPGVGLGQKPPVYLKDGDVVRLGIEGLGEQQQKVHAWNAELLR